MSKEHFFILSARHLRVFLLLLLFAFSFGIRFYKLASIPPGFYYDEAINAMDAKTSADNLDFKAFYPNNNGREGLFVNLSAVNFRLFGSSIQNIRTVAALFGAFSIIIFYLLLRILRFSFTGSFSISFLMATSFWHLNFSRIAFRGILSVFFVVLLAYLSYLALDKNKTSFYLLLGATLGLSFYSYTPLFLAPLLIAFIFLRNHLSITQKTLKITVLVLCALAIATPLLLNFANKPQVFLARQNLLSIFNSEEPIITLGENVLNYSQAFFMQGDQNQRHNHAAFPLLPPFMQILFIAGLLIVFVRNRPGHLREAYLLSLSMIFLFMLPGIFSNEGTPHSLRIIAVLPWVFLICIFPLEQLLYLNRQPASNARFIKPLIITILLALFFTASSQAWLYFGVWAKDQRTYTAFNLWLVELADIIESEPVAQNAYLYTGAQDFRIDSLATLRFLSPVKSEQYATLNQNNLAALNCQDTLIILGPPVLNQADKIKKTCPELRADHAAATNGYYDFILFH